MSKKQVTITLDNEVDDWIEKLRTTENGKISKSVVINKKLRLQKELEEKIPIVN